MSEKSIRIPLEHKIPDHLVREVESKLAYLDERVHLGKVAPDGGWIQLELKQSIDKLELKKIQGKVLRLVESMIRDSYKPKVKILEDHLDREVKFQIDPIPELMLRKEVFREGEGIYSLGPLLTNLINFFERKFISVAQGYGASPYRFPTLVSATFLEKVNYFKAFPHSLSFATHLRSDLDVIEDFSQHAHCEDEGLSTDLYAFAKIQNLLSPAVCYHLYFSLMNQKLSSDSLTATAVGNCFRYESSNLDSLERLWNFSMREIIFIGSKQFVLEQRESARKTMEKFFESIGFVYKVESANDPFFIGEFKQAAFQNAFQLKYEIRASLPYKNSTLAVGSYNYHQDFFGRHLNITLPDDSFVHTGCVAFGLERMALAYVAQFGLDPTQWAEVIRKELP
jgi:seryl-tRNA synthetase